MSDDRIPNSLSLTTPVLNIKLGLVDTRGISKMIMI